MSTLEAYLHTRSVFIVIPHVVSVTVLWLSLDIQSHIRVVKTYDSAHSLWRYSVAPLTYQKADNLTVYSYRFGHRVQSLLYLDTICPSFRQ